MFAAASLLTALLLGTAGAAEPYDWATQPHRDDPHGRSMAKAGAWYTSNPARLAELVDGLLSDADGTDEGVARAVLTPHAGLKQSGPMAARVWSRVTVPDVVIVLAPVHSFSGPRASVWEQGVWHIPGHAFPTDTDLVKRVQELLPDVAPSRIAFRKHEVELNLPFLWRKNPNARLLVLGFHDNEKRQYSNAGPEILTRWGKGIAQLITEIEAGGEQALLLMTTDLVHYVPLTEADEHDPKVLSYIQAYDVDGLYSYIRDNKVSVCGEIPVSVGMVALKELGAEPLAWTGRDTSLHAGKDPSSVVGYPGGVLWR